VTRFVGAVVLKFLDGESVFHVLRDIRRGEAKGLYDWVLWFVTGHSILSVIGGRGWVLNRCGPGAGKPAGSILFRVYWPITYPAKRAPFVQRNRECQRLGADAGGNAVLYSHGPLASFWQLLCVYSTSFLYYRKQQDLGSTKEPAVKDRDGGNPARKCWGKRAKGEKSGSHGSRIP